MLWWINSRLLVRSRSIAFQWTCWLQLPWFWTCYAVYPSDIAWPVLTRLQLARHLRIMLDIQFYSWQRYIHLSAWLSLNLNAFKKLSNFTFQQRGSCFRPYNDLFNLQIYYILLVTLYFESLWYVHVNLFLQLSIQEGSLHRTASSPDLTGLLLLEVLWLSRIWPQVRMFPCGLFYAPAGIFVHTVWLCTAIFVHLNFDWLWTLI